MNILDIHLLYNYNYWANGKILAQCAKVTREQFLAPAEFPYGGLQGTLVHIMEAEKGWLSLFESQTMGEELFTKDFPTLQSIVEIWCEEEKSMRAYLARLSDADMNGHLRYTAFNGEPRDRILWHCLVHVVNHGTQHRSEAAALLTRYGQTPGDLDFTLFLTQSKL